MERDFTELANLTFAVKLADILDNPKLGEIVEKSSLEEIIRFVREFLMIVRTKLPEIKPLGRTSEKSMKDNPDFNTPIGGQPEKLVEVRRYPKDATSERLREFLSIVAEILSIPLLDRRLSAISVGSSLIVPAERAGVIDLLLRFLGISRPSKGELKTQSSRDPESNRIGYFRRRRNRTRGRNR